MKIVIAPDSFKESIGASAVARAIAAGLRQSLPAARLELVPVADGGEGTAEALVAATGGSMRRLRVIGPLGVPVEASWGLLGDGRTAIIEMAQASGLPLVPPGERHPGRTTSYGTGQLLAAAWAAGANRLIVGVGGSATHDGGAGMLQALGVCFQDRHGRTLDGYLCGDRLDEVHALDLADCAIRHAGVQVIAACDVDNPLCGPHGAAAVFGPQKGATPAQVAALDDALARFYARVAAAGLPEVAMRPGAGAAGGLGAALLAFLNADLRPGIDIVIEATGLADSLRDADFLITGEGRLDQQTLHGKAPAGVASLARSLGVPVIAIGGSIADESELLASGLFAAVESAVCRPTSLPQALAEAEVNLTGAGRRVGAWLRLLILK